MRNARHQLRALLKDERGLTLVEVMIASAIWVLVGTLIAGIMFSTVQSQNSILELQGRYHSSRVALDRLEKELTTAFVSLHQGPDRRTKTAFYGKRSQLRFNTSSYEPLQKNSRQSDQLEVEYRLGSIRNAEGQNVQGLLRRTKYHIDDRPGRGGREEILVEGVKTLEFEYFDPLRERWQSDWDVEIDDASELRARLKQVRTLREQAETLAEDEDSGLEGVVAAGIIDDEVDKLQTELMDGMVLPSRIRIRFAFEDPQDKRKEHRLETQVEITMTEPLWY